MITNEMLSRFSADFNAEKCHKIAMNAVTQNGVTKSAMSPMALRKDEHQFSINLKQGEITNQKSSGRCWMFAALNTMRFEIIKKLNLETFELSQNYPLFWDKLEKANYFLENILATLDEPTNGRLIAWLLSSPLGDGGQWDMFCGLIDKYGVVPKDAMPETACSSATGEMDKFMTLKLREYACKLRAMHKDGTDRRGAALPAKEEMLSTIYRMLCICLGEPPKTASRCEVRDKDNNFIRDGGCLTPQEFYQKYVGIEPEQARTALINAPTADKPYGRTLHRPVSWAACRTAASRSKYLNLPERRAQARWPSAQLKDGQPVWFGSRRRPVAPPATPAAWRWIANARRRSWVSCLTPTFPMTKAQRLDYGDSLHDPRHGAHRRQPGRRTASPTAVARRKQLGQATPARTASVVMSDESSDDLRLSGGRGREVPDR